MSAYIQSLNKKIKNEFKGYSSESHKGGKRLWKFENYQQLFIAETQGTSHGEAGSGVLSHGPQSNTLKGYMSQGPPEGISVTRSHDKISILGWSSH